MTAGKIYRKRDTGRQNEKITDRLFLLHGKYWHMNLHSVGGHEIGETWHGVS